LYGLPNACANVSFLPLLVTPRGRRPYLSINLRICFFSAPRVSPIPSSL